MVKKSKGKKGKKSKKVVEKDPNALSEVDKTFYELTITDLNNKLARQRQLTTELQERNEELTQNLRTLDEDRADVIQYLKRISVEKAIEVNEIEERLVALQETRVDEVGKYENTIAQMEKDKKVLHGTTALHCNFTNIIADDESTTNFRNQSVIW